MIRPTTLLVRGLTTLFSQTSPVPYAANSDFRNLKPMKNGRYLVDEDGSHYSEELDTVYYLNSPTLKGQAALVLYSWFDAGGSSSQGGIAQVFRIVDGTLQFTQEIR